MANYSVLKAAVAAVVKTNGNQEITGANMQSTLISIINSLGTGYQFMGVATPSTSPGTPDYNVAYIGGAGTYANFGSSYTVPVGSIGVFKYNGSWTKEAIALFAGIDDEPTAGSDNLVKSSGVYDEINNLSLQQNYIISTYFLASGVINYGYNYFTQRDYIPVKEGDIVTWNPGSATATVSLVEYNENKERINAYLDTAILRDVTMRTGTHYIRASFAVSNLQNAQLLVNGNLVWKPYDGQDKELAKAYSLSTNLAHSINEVYLQTFIQNGSQGNPGNDNRVIVRGQKTIAIDVKPNRKYKIDVNKVPHDGYHYYFRMMTYSTNSPTGLMDNVVRRQVDNWNNVYENGGIIETNSNEYGLTLLVQEKVAPSESADYLPIRYTDFEDGDIIIIDITDSVLYEIEKDIDSFNTRLTLTAKYTSFTPVNGKYVTFDPSTLEKNIATSGQISYIEIPISNIDMRICVTGFTYTPSTGAATTYTRILFFDSSNILISSETAVVDGVMSLVKPSNAAFCYIDAPVAHAGELSIYTDTTIQKANMQNGVIMSSLSATQNITFGYDSIKIASSGFSYIVNGTQYNITGSSDYVFNFNYEQTRQYLCLNTAALLNGSTSFNDVLSVFTNTAPNSDYVVLACTYFGVLESGLLVDYYIRSRQDADCSGSELVVDYETKGKQFTDLYTTIQNGVSFLFFTDPHSVNLGSAGFYASYKPMLKIMQQYFQSLPFDFSLSGGDWLNNSNSQSIACYSLGNIKQQLNTRLYPCYQMLGNHDTNYQGTSALSQETINALMFNDYGKSYYRVDRHNCSLYIFDSGTDGRTTLSDYEKEQLTWFADMLNTETKENIILASHIIIAGAAGQSTIQPFAQAIEDISEAYNDRSTITVNGVVYNYNNSTGKIRCFIGGHTHYDYINTQQPVPIFVTLNTIDTSQLPSRFIITPRFDMILVDFEAGELNAIRVGDGQNRTMTLA